MNKKRKETIKKIVRLIIHVVCGSAFGYLFILFSLILIKYSVGFQTLNKLSMLEQVYWIIAFYLTGATIYIRIARFE